MNTRETLTAFLEEHRKENPVSFHMPGHKGRRFYEKYAPEAAALFDRSPDYDITEIPGADNLFQPETVIRRVMDRYRSLYESRETYLLVNGSSAGLMAAILTAVPQGGKLIMARNCHKSVFNGARLGGITPVYAWPEIIEEYGICGEVTAEEVERAVSEAPEASAVLITSPNYYGICSDIEAIAGVAHRHGMVLIVDQAHGAHLPFMNKKLAAERGGADIVIDSTHKTLASFTQTAIANICSARVDLDVFQDRLQMLESTSPSYILMASLDLNAQILESHGAELMEKWRENLMYFYRRCKEIPGLSLMTHPALDPTKLNLDMSALGLTGAGLEDELIKRGIYTELTTGNIAMAMTGIGNDRSDYDRLLAALAEISENAAARGAAASGDAPAAETRVTAYTTSCASPNCDAFESCDLSHIERQANSHKPETVSVPDKTESVHYTEAAGRISAGLIIPYPPGRPLICPGEIMDETILRYAFVLRQRGEKVIGMTADGFVRVGV